MIDPSISLADLEKFNQGSMVAHLGIEYTDIGERHLSGRMPVDERTIQPQGYLHGGASVALAETLGSLASALMIDREKYTVRGINISASHVGGVKEGYVHGRAELLHAGRSTHLWNIEVSREDGKAVSQCRLTTMIIPI